MVCLPLRNAARLVGLELNENHLYLILSMMSFCMAMASAVTIFPAISSLSMAVGLPLFHYFSLTGLCSQRYACVERVSRHDIRFARSPELCLGLAVNTDIAGSAPQLGMKHFKIPASCRPWRHCAVIHSARVAGRHIFNIPFAEPFDVCLPKAIISARPTNQSTAKYHQHYDITGL